MKKTISVSHNSIASDLELNLIYRESERKARSGKSHLSELAERVRRVDSSLTIPDMFRAMRHEWLAGLPKEDIRYINNAGVGIPEPSLAPDFIESLLKLAKKNGWSWNDPAFHIRHRVCSASDLALIPWLDSKAVESAREAIECGFDVSIMPANLLLPADVVLMKYVPKGDYFQPKPTSDQDPYGIFTEGVAYTAKVRDTNGAERTIVVFSQKFSDTALVNINSTCCHGCVGCYKSLIAREGEANARKYGLSSEVLMAQIDELAKELNRRPSIDQIILSGGEPLLFSNAQLKEILEKLKGIGNLRVLRICTGTLFQGEPFRVDDELLGILRKFSSETGISVKFNVHLNHPNQITPEAVEAAKRIRDNGMNLYAQVPIQSGINFFADDEERTISIWVKLVSMIERFGENYKMIVDMHPRTDEYVPPIEQVVNVVGRVFGSHEFSDNKLPKTVTVLCRQGNLILDPRLFNSMEKRVDPQRKVVTYYWLAQGHSGKWSPVKYVEPLTKYNSDPHSLDEARARYKRKLFAAIKTDEELTSAERKIAGNGGMDSTYSERSKVFIPKGSEWRKTMGKKK